MIGRPLSPKEHDREKSKAPATFFRGEEERRSGREGIFKGYGFELSAVRDDEVGWV